MARFTLPRDLYYGFGSLQALSNLQGRKAMVVTGGGSMKRTGFLDKALGYLQQAGMETQLFDGVEPDPSVETVQRGAAAMQAFSPDWIVSIGGGSPIDAAKAMWVFYEHPDLPFEALLTPFSFPPLRKKARFCAVPSTSGTATEVTAFSVITDYQTGVKYPLADYNITPDVAILDPDLALSMPQTLTAYTGMDALTHAVEAYVSTAHSSFTDPLALEAIRIIYSALPKSCNGDKTAREQMHYAQCMAGMAFSNALLGIVHSMAHKTGAAFTGGHVVHGCANALYLPAVIAFNAKNPEAKRRYETIAAMLLPDTPTVPALIAALRDLNRQLGIPASLQAYENGMVSEAEFLEKLPTIAALALDDACTGSNPRTPTQQEMESLLRAIYYGTDIEW